MSPGMLILHVCTLRGMMLISIEARLFKTHPKKGPYQTYISRHAITGYFSSMMQKSALLQYFFRSRSILSNLDV